MVEQSKLKEKMIEVNAELDALIEKLNEAKELIKNINADEKRD